MTKKNCLSNFMSLKLNLCTQHVEVKVIASAILRALFDLNIKILYERFFVYLLTIKRYAQSILKIVLNWCVMNIIIKILANNNAPQSGIKRAFSDYLLFNQRLCLDKLQTSFFYRYIFIFFSSSSSPIFIFMCL